MSETTAVADTGVYAIVAEALAGVPNGAEIASKAAASSGDLVIPPELEEECARLLAAWRTEQAGKHGAVREGSAARIGTSRSARHATAADLADNGNKREGR